MPRKRTIIVDDSALLESIQECYAADVADLKAHHAAAREAFFNRREWHAGETVKYLGYEIEVVERDGIKYDLPRFAGRTLTASERIRHQDAVRRLEAAGSVTRYGNRIKPVAYSQCPIATSPSAVAAVVPAEEPMPTGGDHA